MTLLSDDAVVRIGGLTGEANTISVADLKAIILAAQVAARYQGMSVEALEPGGAWTASTLAINVTVDDGN